MKFVLPALVLLALLAGCGRHSAHSSNGSVSLKAARQGFVTRTTGQATSRDPVETPPPDIFRVITYSSPAGRFPAYLTLPPKDGAKHPAIVWITGGDCNSIGDVWSEASADNDQTARAFRETGIITLYPSLRGGNTNAGQKEGFFGEVEDVLAAADTLAKQPGVDPKRIYLGGHSTGGTLALLTAEYAPRFRAVFSFGPIDDVAGYGTDSGFLPFDVSNIRELELRAPIRWLDSVHIPVFVFEGTEQGNIGPLRKMESENANPDIHFYPVSGATHFSILAPTTRLIAQKIVADTSSKTNIAFQPEELNKPFGQ